MDSPVLNSVDLPTMATKLKPSEEAIEAARTKLRTFLSLDLPYGSNDEVQKALASIEVLLGSELSTSEKRGLRSLKTSITNLNGQYLKATVEKNRLAQ